MYNCSRYYLENLGRQGAHVTPDTDGYSTARVLDTYDISVWDEDESIAPHLKDSGFWESWITSWFTQWIRPGMTVLDIGAHCGYYTMLFESLVGPLGHVVAYEPNPVYDEALMRTRKANDAKFTIRPYAVGPGAAKVELHVPKHLTGSAAVGVDLSNYNETIVEVDQTYLDYEFERNIFDFPQIIKIDAEGSEQGIWQGAHKIRDYPRHTTFVMEWTPGAYTDDFIVQLMEWGTVSVINFDGGETRIGPDFLNSQEDWVMIVVRKR